MTNITALLLVLTLTGAPVAASIVCVAECHHEPAALDDCHADMATSDGPMMSASDTCSDPSFSDTPFVIKHRAAAGAAVLAATLSPTTLEPARADAPAVLARATVARLNAPLVLRL